MYKCHLNRVNLCLFSDVCKTSSVDHKVSLSRNRKHAYFLSLLQTRCFFFLRFEVAWITQLSVLLFNSFLEEEEDEDEEDAYLAHNNTRHAHNGV